MAAAPAPEKDAPPKKIRAYLVAAGDYHDIDFARLELLKLFAEHPNIRVQVAHDFHDVEAIAASDFLVTYTCNVIPTEAQQKALRAYVAGGKRWFALHGTNSILRLLSSGLWDAPRWAPLHMQTLGSQFIAHPPIAPYRVTVADPSHPLVQGVEPFDTTDELYLMETHGKLHVLLETQFAGDGTGFVEHEWKELRSHPVFYIHTIGKGAVLYLTLGHCRGHYDLQPLLEWWPTVERCAWDLPVFYTMLRRGIEWIKTSPGAEQ